MGEWQFAKLPTPPAKRRALGRQSELLQVARKTWRIRGVGIVTDIDFLSKNVPVLSFNIHEDDPLDEAHRTAWVKQASELPGERM